MQFRSLKKTSDTFMCVAGTGQTREAREKKSRKLSTISYKLVMILKR